MEVVSIIGNLDTDRIENAIETIVEKYKGELTEDQKKMIKKLSSLRLPDMEQDVNEGIFD